MFTSQRKRIVAALRRNLLPGLVLQAVAICLVLLYYFCAPARPGFVALAEWKRCGGYWFSAVSTALCGGLLPFLVLLGSGRIASGQRLQQAVFYLVFWAWKGVEVDMLYRLQARFFGVEAEFGVIARKVV